MNTIIIWRTADNRLVTEPEGWSLGDKPLCSYTVYDTYFDTFTNDGTVVPAQMKHLLPKDIQLFLLLQEGK